MQNQIRSMLSVARQSLQDRRSVRLMLAGVLLVAGSALLPIRDALNVLTPSSEKVALASAVSVTTHLEAMQAQWQLAKRDPAILQALQAEWLDVKQKFNAEFGAAFAHTP